MDYQHHNSVQDKVIVKFKEVHGDTYNYSLVQYIKNNIKVKIICQKHGVFEQTPEKHKQGKKCPRCSKGYKFLQEDVLDRFKTVHRDKYDYSLFEYNGNNIKSKIICPEHGVFEQAPNVHWNGSGCPKCKIKNLFLNNKDVLDRFKTVHQDKYNYSLFEYNGNNIKSKIICPEHGVFEQTPINHWNGQGCPFCLKNKKLSQEEVLKKFNKVHKDKYDYSLVEYINRDTKVKIICPEHGVFDQNPSSHWNGYGCPHCSKENYKENNPQILSQFKVLSQFQKVHRDKYDYSLFEYNGNNIKSKIICPEHGVFEQVPMTHKIGVGCPQCKTNSKEEFLIDLFKEYNINYIYNDRNLIKPLEIDILVPDFNFGIEHNGLLFHSYGISNWSATDNYDKLDKRKHLLKTIEMEKNKYQLFHIREDHLLNENKKDIWKSILLNKCGISHKIHTRKLQVIDLSNHNSFTKEFLENNHLQGHCNALIQLGLQDTKTGDIYSIMTFGKSRFNKNIEYELLRFCNLKFHNVRGAASKLLKTFERMYKPSSIISYANRDWSMGNLYSKLGFKYSHTSEPNYIYININTFEIISREKTKKHKLKDFLESRDLIFKEELSERDNMILNGFRIYYDTGNLVYHKYYKEI